MRRFAIPYNGSDPDDFLKRLEPYKDRVDHIFFGLTAMFDNYRKVEWTKKFVKSFDEEVKDSVKKYYTNDKIFNRDLNNISKDEYDRNVLSFLEKTKDGPYKRLLTLNKMLWEMGSNEMDEFVENTLVPFVEQYNVQGILIGEYEMARTVRNHLPDVEIHLSICSKISDPTTVRRWHNEVRISSFNIPSDFSRNKDAIKAIHGLGIKTKMLVNESCVCGCPMSVSHQGYISGVCPSKHTYRIYCDTVPLRTAFQGCFILPRHLKMFDDCVDIFKISTRHTASDKLFRIIDYYMSERDDDINVWEIICGRMFRRLKQVHIDNPSFNIPINKIPDKVVFCNCLDCDKCDICSKLMEKFFDRGNTSDLKYLI